MICRAVPLAAVLVAACARQPVPPAAAPVQVLSAEAAPWAGLDDQVIPDLPLWTNKYADTRDDFGIFLRIDGVKESQGLSRLDAVEVQNRFRDGWRAGERDVQALFDASVRAVKAGERESGVDPERLAEAPFIAVFDLDETLYDQYYDGTLGEVCHSFSFEHRGKPKHIQLAPGWEEAFSTVRELGGAIVLFSANTDDTNFANLAHWRWEGTLLTEHPDIAGVFTNSYLTLQSKDEGDDPDPVSEPSKDLRMFDEDLERVVLIDDNPNRVFHYANLRVSRKFHADEWCLEEVDAPFKAALAGELPAFSAELRDAVGWLEDHEGATFQQAMLPFSWTGRVAVDALMVSNGWSAEQAVAYVRAHPESADSAF